MLDFSIGSDGTVALDLFNQLGYRNVLAIVIHNDLKNKLGPESAFFRISD